MNQVACYNEMNQDDTDTLSDSNSESNESMAQDDDDSSLVNLDLDNDEEVMDGDFEDEEDDYEEEEKVTPSADPSTLTVLFSPITKSLFPNRDATIHFVYDGQMLSHPLPKADKIKWKAGLAPKVVKATIKRMGFPVVKTGKDFFGYWGRHIAPNRYGPVKHFQTINHFPMSFEAGRKDKMYVNWLKMKARLERSEQARVQYCPETFILPGDRRALKRHFSSQSLWIVKPPASARGLGIRVISSWSLVPKKKPVIVSRYISNPYLIQKRKFDLRLYVLVTSFDPLRIYLYEEGVVRFAAEPYRASVTSKKLRNKFIHLTNYSISKKKKSDDKNKDTPTDASDPFSLRDNKWNFATFKQFLEKENVNSNDVFKIIKELIVKTMISVQVANQNGMRSLANPSSCYELFGFDVLLDADLKPWLLEVNISPSLKVSSEIDQTVKSRLIVDTFNLAGYSVKDMKSYQEFYSKSKKYKKWTQSYLTKEEKEKHREALLSKPGSFDMLSCFTKEDFDVLQTFEDENARRGSYQRIYPAADVQSYLSYFQCQSYCDRLLAQWVAAEPLDAMRVQKLLARLASQDSAPSLSSLTGSKMWSKSSDFKATASSASTRSSNATLSSSSESSSTQIKTLTKSLRRVLIHQ